MQGDQENSNNNHKQNTCFIPKFGSPSSWNLGPRVSALYVGVCTRGLHVQRSFSQHQSLLCLQLSQTLYQICSNSVFMPQHDPGYVEYFLS